MAVDGPVRRVVGVQRAEPAPGKGGNAEAQEALHEAFRVAKRAMPGVAIRLEAYAHNPQMRSQSAVLAARLLYQIATETLPTEAAEQPGAASAKLLLVDVQKAERLLREERLAERERGQ